MRILLVKTSSLGDVIHNLPVASDIRRHLPQARVDWCVEDSFAAVPHLHPALERIIPVAVRRWRKALFSGATWREIGEFRQRVREVDYDLVLDTQGLLKSACLACQANGLRGGYAGDSAKERLAASFYQRHYHVARDLHAVVRNRMLAGAALGYPVDTPVDYGIQAPAIALDWLPAGPFVVLLSATSRDDKLWPEAHWIELGRHLAGQGLGVVLPAGNPHERARAARLAAAIPGALAAPPMRIDALATLLAKARAVVGVDTGLTHLAVALNTPTIALYTATDPGLTGVYGTGMHRNLGGAGQCPAVAAVLVELMPALG